MQYYPTDRLAWLHNKLEEYGYGKDEWDRIRKDSMGDYAMATREFEGIAMIHLKGGEISLRIPFEEERELHKLDDFWIGQTEVTQRQYAAVMQQEPPPEKTANHPVENVTWFEAMDFCRRLNARLKEAGSLPDGLVCRLPTKAEWEYACAAGARTKYFFGDDIQPLPRYAWIKQRGDVTAKEPNPWGLYGCYGNVSEWGLDKWQLYIRENPEARYYLEWRTRTVCGAGACDESPSRHVLQWFVRRPKQYGIDLWCPWSLCRLEAIPKEGDEKRGIGFRIVLGPPTEGIGRKLYFPD